MKICVLFGGPHKKGNTATLLEEVLEGARNAGHSVQRLDVGDLDIHPCKGCMACKKPKATGCVQKDDMAGVLDAVRAADILIFASPMYWWNVAAPLKTVIDRFFALSFAMPHSELQGKKALLVMTTGQPADSDGREGLEAIFKRMCVFTGMEWLGIVTTGTNDVPLAEQQEVLTTAREVGMRLS